LVTASTDAAEANSALRSRVLVVDDSEDYRELIGEPLANEGFSVQTAVDGRDALERARSFQPDIIILDLGLPDMDGVEVCRRIRTFSDAYIVMLTARDDEVDKVVGLSVGADDYVTKPFSLRELVARIHAILRRPRATPDDESRRIGDLRIDRSARQVFVGDDPVELTRVEFDLLDALSENPRIVLTRAVLLERLFGPDWIGDDHVLDVHVSNLRRKLGDGGRAPKYVVTVRGVGYRMGTGS